MCAAAGSMAGLDMTSGDERTSIMAIMGNEDLSGKQSVEGGKLRSVQASGDTLEEKLPS